MVQYLRIRRFPVLQAAPVAEPVPLSLHCLRQTDSCLYRYGVQALMDAQLESGAVPERKDALEGERRPTEEEEHDVVFRRCYHTTLVAAIAAGICPGFVKK